MPIAYVNGLHIYYQLDGDRDAPAVVFANSLGTDLRLWDAIMPLLPKEACYLRYDKRGHGLSDCPAGQWQMSTLAEDIAALMDHLGLKDAIFVGLSIGGMIGQALAVMRMDLVRGLVLSNTGAKIATQQIWQDRIDTVNAHGIEALADATMARWFSDKFRKTADMHLWRNMLVGQRSGGYAACSAAIQRTDLKEATSGLRLPALGIAGTEDGATPPDLVRETLALIPGSDLRLIRGAGHLPCVETPETYAHILTEFLHAQGIQG